MIDNRSSFDILPISQVITRGLIDSGHYRATPIQEIAITHMKTSHLIMLSPSGTGKTCAFSILMLNTILEKHPLKNLEMSHQPTKGFIYGLVLAPTPELCQQIAKEIQSISRYLPLSIISIISSIKLEEDWQEINTAHIVVATPGIVLKLLMKKKLKIYSLQTIVIDEWDKMLGDEGLSANLTMIFKKFMPSAEQWICSSATYSQDAFVKLNKIRFGDWHLIKSVLGNLDVFPQHHQTDELAQMPTTITIDNSSGASEFRDSINLICRAGSFNKRLNLMIDFFRKVDFYQALIFCNIHQFSKYAEIAINEAGFPCCFVSSQMEQRERLDRISEFRDMQWRCLIATDIIARGLDVMNVNVVISLDFPYEDQTFLHRIGRAGRFMSNQISLTFYKRSESKKLTQLHDNCNVDFVIYNKDHPPQIELLPLQNETLLDNYTKLVNIAETAKQQEIEAERLAEQDRNVVPMMFYCDKDGDYWDTYASMCQQYKPPFF